MTNAEYLAELAFRLRWRHVGEARVTEEIAKVSAELTPSAERAEQLFGTPAEYAARVPRGKMPSRGYLVASVLAAIAVVVAAVRVVFSLVLGQEQNLWVSVAIYTGALLWAVLGTALGAHLDRRLPGAG